MDIARRAAYLALKDVDENRAYSNFAVNGVIKKLNPDRPAFLRELVYGTLKKQMYLDYVIGNFVKTPIKKLPSSDRILLRLGIYQISSLDSVPDYAAVSETVELAKFYARGRENFINGVLRQYIRDRDYVTLPSREEDETRYLSIKYSFAPWIVEMWLKQFESAERVEQLLDALNQRPRFCIRANTLKTEPAGLKARLEGQGFSVEADEDFPDLFFIDGEKPLSTNLYKSGLFSVQDKGSRIAAESLGALPGDTVVDVCAAPGGKTMAIAESMKNFGKISATDIYKRKVDLIEAEAARLGVKIVTAWSWDGRVIDSELADAADRVLVDAPCSGLGTVRRKPEIKYKEFDEAMQSLPQMQLDILKASAHYVKPGGILVYSTCTISKRENEDVVDAFLRANREFEMLDMIQLMPTTGKTDGFFVCKMKRAGGFFGE
ncbi:MAG: 16S rRNA (cytosine(967)-C(5))-methyltransferase RsmB [Clostridiales Family XIII bacterium]|jgi:16S rRNA (cytosine967-C5)-methyltransferase|nr:16S rRNA (cytosine(967)-C(5))-methyltransferase RsmB [Clostridiales Family XIII bacterium]